VGLSSFNTASAGERLDLEEIVALTRAMIPPASASLIGEAFPGSPVFGFALVRRVETVGQILDPCNGRISYVAASGDTRRDP
jgi:hypothetical protein